MATQLITITKLLEQYKKEQRELEFSKSELERKLDDAERKMHKGKSSIRQQRYASYKGLLQDVAICKAKIQHLKKFIKDLKNLKLN